MSIQEAALRLPWYRSLSRDQWKALIASNLGWTFDGFEVFALFLTIGFALQQLLMPRNTRHPALCRLRSSPCTVFGWATGGVLGGIMADYIGRKRTMMLTILAYSLLTGLSAFAWDWESFAVLRFLVGVAIGSEWATGASISLGTLAGQRARQGRRLLQSGAVSAAFSHPPLAVDRLRPVPVPGADVPDRCVAGVDGVLDPAQHPESPRWEESNRRRREAHEQQRQGAALKGDDAALPVHCRRPV